MFAKLFFSAFSKLVMSNVLLGCFSSVRGESVGDLPATRALSLHSGASAPSGKQRASCMTREGALRR